MPRTVQLLRWQLRQMCRILPYTIASLNAGLCAVKLTATGSFKRPQDVGQASQAAARAVAASQITQPQDVDSGNGSAGEGQHDRDPGPTTPQSRRKVGEALTVRGRGRGRHAPAVQKGARSG